MSAAWNIPTRQRSLYGPELTTGTSYQVLPNFVSFAQRDQMIITAENSAFQSGFHG